MIIQCLFFWKSKNTLQNTYLGLNIKYQLFTLSLYLLTVFLSKVWNFFSNCPKAEALGQPELDFFSVQWVRIQGSHCKGVYVYDHTASYIVLNPREKSGLPFGWLGPILYKISFGNVAGFRSLLLYIPLCSTIDAHKNGLARLPIKGSS